MKIALIVSVVLNVVLAIGVGAALYMGKMAVESQDRQIAKLLVALEESNDRNATLLTELESRYTGPTDAEMRELTERLKREEAEFVRRGGTIGGGR